MVRTNRRRFLAAVAAGGTVGVGGCLWGGFDEWDGWTATYRDGEAPTVFADVASMGDERVLAVGSRLAPTGREGLAVMYDGSGERLWACTYGGADDVRFDGAVWTDAAGIHVAGTRTVDGAPRPWLLSLEPDGTTEWERTFGTTAAPTRVTDLEPDGDGELLLIGHRGQRQSRAWVAKTVIDDELRWQRTYRPEGVASATFAAGFADDGCLVTGAVREAETRRTRGYAVRLGALGEVEWARTYPTGPLRGATRGFDGDFAIAGGAAPTAKRPSAFTLRVDGEGRSKGLDRHAEGPFATLTDVAPRQEGFSFGGGPGEVGYFAGGLVGDSPLDHESVLLSLDDDGGRDERSGWDADIGAVRSIEPLGSEEDYVAVGYVGGTPHDGTADPAAMIEASGGVG